MPSPLDSFVSQLVCPQIKADPFRRVSPIKESALVLVEFCQVLGPKPVKWYPEDVKTFNFDQIALWLMSAENEHGSTVKIFNQQLGIFAIIQYSTLLDITARAFQRPFALAFICGEEISPELSKRFAELHPIIFNPLLTCNRQMFTNLTEQMVHLAQSIEADDFNKFYAIASDEPTPEMSKRLHELAQQVKRTSPRLKNAYYVLSSHNDSSCLCGSSTEDFKIFFPLLGQSMAADLMPLFYICPCSVHGFNERFEETYQSLTEKRDNLGGLYVCNIPITDKSIKTGMTSLSSIRNNMKFEYSNTLISLNKVFHHLLFAILSGDRIVAFASNERRSTLIDVLKKFCLLRPMKIHDDYIIYENEADFFLETNKFQIAGIIATRSESAKCMTKTDYTKLSTKIDLNNQKLMCRHYSGQLLKPFARLSFPSDQALISYVAYVLTNISRLAILVNNSSLEKVITDFKLPSDDQLILENILIEMNFEKFGTLLKARNEPESKLMSFTLNKSHGMYSGDLQTPSTSSQIPEIVVKKDPEPLPKVTIQLGPTTRSLAVKKLSECINEDAGIDGHSHSHADDDHENDFHESDPTPTCSDNVVAEDEIKHVPKKNQVWSSSETNKFFQGLKEHGKNFELISQFMAKYKIKRDRVQIQKYYFNTFKAYRAVTKLSEDDFKNIPRDAKELFIIINGCEWKQKTLGAKICQESFKQLLLNGTVTVKLKNRKILLKTPTCKALRQFFKYDEKFANIPRQLGIKLTPNNYRDKDYVISCEQNPYLYVKVDMNDSLSNIFKLLQKKWIPRNLNLQEENESKLPKFKLIITQTTAFPKLIVRPLDDAQRRMCLQGLIKYCEDRNEIMEEQQEACTPGFASPSSSNHGIQMRKKSKPEDIPSSVIVDCCSFTDFSLKHDVLTEGLSHENIENVSALHLYLITGMQAELGFSYQVLNLPKPAPSVWDLFVSFVKRDYLWYGTDYMVHGTTHAFRKRKKLHQKKKRRESIEENHKEEDTAIVEDEMLGFLEQWNSMSKTSATLNQPETEQPQPQLEPQPSTSIPSVVATPSLNTSMPPPPLPPSFAVTVPLQQSQPIAGIRPPVASLIARPRSIINRKRKVVDTQTTTTIIPITNTVISQISTSRPTDFSFLNPSAPSTSSTSIRKEIALTVTNEHTSNTLDHTIDGSSLQRALTDEFSNQLGLMAQQNSVDYCRQFEDFVNYFQSPKKASKLQ
uniref:SANT domain-containing protein n=1 Tax=Panagrolaimus superbus TaxID=310955 RepID=A0A914YWQ4_9BILA